MIFVVKYFKNYFQKFTWCTWSWSGFWEEKCWIISASHQCKQRKGVKKIRNNYSSWITKVWWNISVLWKTSNVSLILIIIYENHLADNWKSNLTFIWADHSCSLMAATIILSLMGAPPDVLLVPSAVHVVQREVRWDRAKVGSLSWLAV